MPPRKYTPDENAATLLRRRYTSSLANQPVVSDSAESISKEGGT